MIDMREFTGAVSEIWQKVLERSSEPLAELLMCAKLLVAASEGARMAAPRGTTAPTDDGGDWPHANQRSPRSTG